mgnify:CR=1 FL=1
MRSAANEALQELEFLHGNPETFFGPPEDFAAESDVPWDLAKSQRRGRSRTRGAAATLDSSADDEDDEEAFFEDEDDFEDDFDDDEEDDDDFEDDDDLDDEYDDDDDDEVADDAAVSIKSLRKTREELMKEFQDKSKEEGKI